MIGADFPTGPNLDHGDPETLLFSMTRSFSFCLKNNDRLSNRVARCRPTRFITNGLAAIPATTPRGDLITLYSTVVNPFIATE